ncbi:MAG: hypothetical protein FJ405_17750, partial [Verrucomicrobia bacterium]|nr:hypothetical protein [Verrucomicrobiota bacterium]
MRLHNPVRPPAYFLAAVLSVLLHCSEQCRAASAPRDRTVTTLTRLDEIHRLSVEAAASKIPVKVEATVTFYAQAQYLMFLANESGYGYVMLHHHLHAYEELQAGDLIEVQGVTSPGGFLPMIIAPEGSRLSIVRKGRAPLPEPEKATCGEIITDPDLDCHWLETEVLVSHVFFHPPFAALELNCENTSLRAIIPGFTNASTIPWDLA